MGKPFSQACENNKRPILEVLQRRLGDVSSVLEIGSGTGQHAVFFAEQLPHLQWRTSDLVENHAAIRQWIDDAKLPNVLAPVALDVTEPHWPIGPVPAVFSANTAHIMAWPVVQAFLQGVGRVLAPGGLFLLYGPFNYEGGYTSESNARFDEWLAQRDPESAIRHFEDVERESRTAGLSLVEDVAMPANNRLLVWRAAG
ncbi:MAG: DUF938 domain-containing protein [Myxococcota bacterium]|jgi:cyclopropane fatty-acyl-phospholipid synthase-like methyltransferase